MTYFIIRQCGDFSVPCEVTQEVFDRDGKHYVTSTFTDIYDEVRECDEEVYESKKETWKIILKRIDSYIADMQKTREKMFAMALEDGTFRQSNEEFKNWMENLTNTQPQAEFINKRMTEVK